MLEWQIGRWDPRGDMAGDPVEPAHPHVWFAVDGTTVDARGWCWYPHRWAGGAFATGYDQLLRLLPSPPLYPVRISRNRALVCAWGAYVPAVGHEPPYLGFGEIALMAFVTCGQEPAPPLLPGLGRRAMKRFGFGFFPVMVVVTNRVAAELYRILFGIPSSVADIRVEQRFDRERFVCEADGQLVWDLTVRSDGRPSAGIPDAEDWFYTVEGGEVFRSPVGGSGISAVAVRVHAGCGAMTTVRAGVLSPGASTSDTLLRFPCAPAPRVRASRCSRRSARTASRNFG